MNTAVIDIKEVRAEGQEPSLLAGVNVLLEGPGGTGKTYSIGTLVDSGVEVFCFFTETSGLEALLGYWTDHGKSVPNNLHWNVLKKPPGSFGAMAKMADTINRTSMDALFKMQDPNRHMHNQWVDMLRILNDFTDQRTGVSYGDVGTWGPDKALVFDNLSGLNPIAFSLVIGAKLLKDQRDWGAAMDLIEKLFRLATDGCNCHVICIAHIEREVDLVQGGAKITVATLGVKLAPKLVPMFSDVILAVREGSKFTWSTANSQADLKARNLPIQDGITPDFKLIIAKWISRGGRLSPTVKS